MQLQRELDRLGGKHKAIKDELAIAMTLATEVAVALEEQGEGEKVRSFARLNWPIHFEINGQILIRFRIWTRLCSHTSPWKSYFKTMPPLLAKCETCCEMKRCVRL